MKTYLLLFLFLTSGLFCIADTAIPVTQKSKGNNYELQQQLSPSATHIEDLNQSPMFVIKLLKLIWLIIMLIVATILPPLAVLLYFGAHKKFWVCLLLTVLGFVPGIIYAWIQIIKGRRARKQAAI